MTQQDSWTGTGYDAPASAEGGIFLHLKSRGEQARLRLVSEPYRYLGAIRQPDSTEKTVRKVAWIAIDKRLVDKQAERRVVVFVGGPMVYAAIQQLREDPDWGDPSLYDILVTRTEESGRYYTVTPMPKPIGPLSEAEQTLIDANPINLAQVCQQGGQQPQPAGPDDDPFADD